MGVDLENSDLIGANLNNANPLWADLEKTNLSGANFTGVKLKQGSNSIVSITSVRDKKLREQ